MTKLDLVTQLCQIREDLETLRLDLHLEAAIATRLLDLGARLDALIDALFVLEDR